MLAHNVAVLFSFSSFFLFMGGECVGLDLAEIPWGRGILGSVVTV